MNRHESYSALLSHEEVGRGEKYDTAPVCGVAKGMSAEKRVLPQLQYDNKGVKGARCSLLYIFLL